MSTESEDLILISKQTQRTKITPPIVLHRDLQSLTPPQSLATPEDFDELRSFAADRDAWKDLTGRVVTGLTAAASVVGRRQKSQTSPRAAACAATDRQANEEEGDC
ncbi:hypothetical protein SDRG_08877 [Saprolegnia diclina VS20]|uniref:Uncharacterized protein n=1 Tax=Saprolegnia diclina (strain VS20) TaxID=1156394 RepID=T0QJ47_SAPDV|nr:hypothetical protein SDRG_08877 [Saprolegnia diclina VS20]EQC33775.1 hypothetical protein SDRG_08877 [Saprolegnia diclina VS20]|eukprot:XP_008612998.1 hypothetical protein SDRG_08877 [Saprolegnia diclina VS20]